MGGVQAGLTPPVVSVSGWHMPVHMAPGAHGRTRSIFGNITATPKAPSARLLPLRPQPSTTIPAYARLLVTNADALPHAGVRTLSASGCFIVSASLGRWCMFAHTVMTATAGTQCTYANATWLGTRPRQPARRSRACSHMAHCATGLTNSTSVSTIPLAGSLLASRCRGDNAAKHNQGGGEGEQGKNLPWEVKFHPIGGRQMLRFKKITEKVETKHWWGQDFWLKKMCEMCART